MFSFSVFTPGGVLVTGPNTLEAKVSVDKIEGEGHVDLAVDRLMSLLGDHDLSAGCVNDTVTHSYDRRHCDLRFVVRPGMPHETYGGPVPLDGRWSIG